MRVYDEKYAQWEFKLHGESWLQQRMSGKFKTILDVGSNIGEWTKMTKQFQPQAEIHMFEIVPETHRIQLQNIKHLDNVYSNGFGLSSYNGTVDVKCQSNYNPLSTIVHELNIGKSKIKPCLVIKGDDYLESREINSVDYLKIDTEGAEQHVLKGFERSLAMEKIKIIQFEYTHAAILAKWLLKDAYDYLEPFGYKLGRLCKDHIKFKSYAIADENFNGPDFIAVHYTAWDMFGLKN